MAIIPREKPVIENLNSYYLVLEKLFEHYQGELGSGAIHFESSSAEGVVFFDKDDLLNGILKDKGGEIQGKKAIERIIDVAGNNSFSINIYAIDPDKIYLWANLPDAKRIYNNLSTEFTDLEGLIKKMVSEKLTGYIDVSINDGNGDGLIFFNNGEIQGGSYSWGKGELSASKKNQELLIEKTKKSGGVFNVSRISLSKTQATSESKETERNHSSGVLVALEDLLGIFERVVISDKKIKDDFDALLKKKFVEKADKYSFLDPFAGEFEYSDHSIRFSGNASDKELVNALIESVEEIAGDLGILPLISDKLVPWSQTYAKELEQFGISY
jgi:hypothetical protein